MKAIILNTRDGDRHLAFVAPADFDTQAWAESRRDAFKILNIIKVIEMDGRKEY